MSKDISNSDDTIDVRDLIARVEELREELNEERESLNEAKDEAEALLLEATEGSEGYDGALENSEAAEEAIEDWKQSDYVKELALLERMLSELAGSGGDEQWEGDWYPVTLIRDSYFVEAMQELVEDIGDMPQGTPSYLVIDWEATADNLRVDYSSVKFDGVTYWYR